MQFQVGSGVIWKMHKDESWETDTTQFFQLVARVLEELWSADHWCKMTGFYPPTPLVDIAEKDAKAYIDVGAKGVPK
jgi:hypothetical protein